MTPFDVAVVGRVQDVSRAAAAAAYALAAQSEERTALIVCVGEAPRPPALGAVIAARRLRDRLCARDIDAWAAGRLVRCCAAGRSTAEQAAAAAGSVVLAVCGPRPAWAEPLLDEAGTVLVVGSEAEPLTAIALAGLWDRGLQARAVVAPDGLSSRLWQLGIGTPAHAPTGLRLDPAAPA